GAFGIGEGTVWQPFPGREQLIALHGPTVWRGHHADNAPGSALSCLVRCLLSQSTRPSRLAGCSGQPVTNQMVEVRREQLLDRGQGEIGRKAVPRPRAEQVEHGDRRTAGTTSSTALAGVRTTFGSASSGSHGPTGSSSAIRPSSTSIMTAAAVMGLVIEARRKIESLAIAAPPTAIEPATATSARSPRATRPTAPGSDPSPT